MLLWAPILVWAIASAWITIRRRLWRLDHIPPSHAEASIAPLLLGAGMLIWFAQILGTAGAAASPGSSGSPSLSSAALLIAGGIAGGGLATIASLVIFKPLRSALAPSPPFLRDLRTGAIAFAIVMPWVLIVGGVMTFVETLRARAAGEEEPGAIAHTTLALLTDPETIYSFPWWAVVVIVIVGTAALEEIIFRGCLQGSLERALVGVQRQDERRASGARWLAIIVTSLIFASVHITATPWYGLVTLFALSLGFGAAHARTGGRMLVPIVMHGLFNAANVGMAVGGVS